MARFLARSVIAVLTLLSSANAATFVFPRADSSGSRTCPADAPLSCQNTTAVQDTCCFNAPGGQLLLTQFWDTNPPTGPVDSWTVHGLWPDKCDGTFEANCDSRRAYTNITDILKAAGADATLSYMSTYWKDYQGDDETFWEHEWGKHGTCISTLNPSCYDNYKPTQEAVDFFNKAVELFKALPSYQWLADAGITPSTSVTYTSDQIQKVLSAKHGKPVTLGCSSGALDQIWYHYNVQGSVQSGTFVPANPDGTKSTCPATGVKYLPKNASSSPTTTATATKTSTAPTPTGSATPFSGKAFLKVTTSGAQKGCIISAGTWYDTQSCATFTATSVSGGFTLTSSKGKCAVDAGTLRCGTSSAATVFTADGSKLLYNGSANFYAASVPSGSTQVDVSTASGKVQLGISWASS